MIEDDKKYYIMDKRTKGGHTDGYCLLCSKSTTVEHIGHRPRSQHRHRRIHPEDYVSEADAEQWKKDEAMVIGDDKKKTRDDVMAIENETFERPRQSHH